MLERIHNIWPVPSGQCVARQSPAASRPPRDPRDNWPRTLPDSALRLIVSILSGLAHRLRHAAAALPEPQARRLDRVAHWAADAAIDVGDILDDLGRPVP